jgi:glyoxylase-like metal-dependent hydrolase (beta-lactamase superfamily II)
MKLLDNLYVYPERGMLDCNTYIIKDKITVLIDPGSAHNLSELVAGITHDGIDPKDINIITNTHLHPDHCWANETFKKISGGKILIHQEQKQFYDSVLTGVSKLFGLQGVAFKEDGYLDSKLNIGETELEFILSPGHSPESFCCFCRGKEFLICGDVIFDKSIGRVDILGGDAGEIKRSIERLSCLNIQYLLPGHMNIVSRAEKVKENFEFIKKYAFQWL